MFLHTFDLNPLHRLPAYVIELHIPADKFPNGKITPGESIGFDLTVNNLDRSDNFQEAIQLRWSSSGWSFFSTRDFGSLMISP